MYIIPDADHLSFREARANLSALLNADKARVILVNHHPAAILVPIHLDHVYHPGPKSRAFAAARRAFLAALKEMRTH